MSKNWSSFKNDQLLMENWRAHLKGEPRPGEKVEEFFGRKKKWADVTDAPAGDPNARDDSLRGYYQESNLMRVTHWIQRTIEKLQLQDKIDMGAIIDEFRDMITSQNFELNEQEINRGQIMTGEGTPLFFQIDPQKHKNIAAFIEAIKQTPEGLATFVDKLGLAGFNPKSLQKAFGVQGPAARAPEVQSSKTQGAEKGGRTQPGGGQRQAAAAERMDGARREGMEATQLKYEGAKDRNKMTIWVSSTVPEELRKTFYLVPSQAKAIQKAIPTQRTLDRGDVAVESLLRDMWAVINEATTVAKAPAPVVGTEDRRTGRIGRATEPEEAAPAAELQPIALPQLIATIVGLLKPPSSETAQNAQDIAQYLKAGLESTGFFTFTGGAAGEAETPVEEPPPLPTEPTEEPPPLPDNVITIDFNAVQQKVGDKVKAPVTDYILQALEAETDPETAKLIKFKLASPDQVKEGIDVDSAWENYIQDPDLGAEPNPTLDTVKTVIDAVLALYGDAGLDREHFSPWASAGVTPEKPTEPTEEPIDPTVTPEKPTEPTDVTTDPEDPTVPPEEPRQPGDDDEPPPDEPTVSDDEEVPPPVPDPTPVTPQQEVVNKDAATLLTFVTKDAINRGLDKIVNAVVEKGGEGAQFARGIANMFGAEQKVKDAISGEVSDTLVTALQKVKLDDEAAGIIKEIVGEDAYGQFVAINKIEDENARQAKLKALAEEVLNAVDSTQILQGLWNAGIKGHLGEEVKGGFEILNSIPLIGPMIVAWLENKVVRSFKDDEVKRFQQLAGISPDLQITDTATWQTGDEPLPSDALVVTTSDDDEPVDDEPVDDEVETEKETIKYSLPKNWHRTLDPRTREVYSALENVHTRRHKGKDFKKDLNALAQFLAPHNSSLEVRKITESNRKARIMKMIAKANGGKEEMMKTFGALRKGPLPDGVSRVIDTMLSYKGREGGHAPGDDLSQLVGTIMSKAKAVDISGRKKKSKETPAETSQTSQATPEEEAAAMERGVAADDGAMTASWAAQQESLLRESTINRWQLIAGIKKTRK